MSGYSPRRHAGRASGTRRYWSVEAFRRAAVAGLLVVLVCFLTPPVASAAPPENDNFADATVITSLPFSDFGNLDGTTTEPAEPQFCTTQVQTVWYSFTATSDTVLDVDLAGSDFGVVINVYRVSSGDPGTLDFVACQGSFGSLYVSAEQGVTYYFQVGSAVQGSLGMSLTVDEVPPPVNDQFVDATPVLETPFTATVENVIAATVEPDEPFPCAGGSMQGSVWWAFTPSIDGLYLAQFGGAAAVSLAVYTGGSLGELSLAACASGDRISFGAAAGTTYYVRAQIVSVSLNLPMHFSLDTTPPAQADIFYFPEDPSVIDTIQFIGSSFDPAGIGIESWSWAFGDGATADGCCPSHQYSHDGDYFVSLSVTTFDGRTASSTVLLPVRTHDVAVVKVAVPKSARVGHTIEVNVHVQSLHYPENVRVSLQKSTVSGFEVVGDRTQSVAVKAGAGATLFRFDYTIAETDLSLGRLTFVATADITDHRDARPADNEYRSTPVTVRER